MIYGQESEILEFKRSTSEIEEALQDIAAILNKSGAGELYFGICNNGEVIGQQVATSTLRKVSQAIGNHIAPTIYPTIEKVVIAGKDCVRVVFDGSNAPYYYRGRAYIRVSEESKLMAPAKLKEFIREQIETAMPWDSSPSDIGLEDIDKDAVTEYIAKANEAGRLAWTYSSIEDAMRRLKLVSDGKLVNSAKVMFGKEPGLSLKMAVFATDVKATFNDIRIVGGNVSKLVNAAEAYIKNTMHWRVEFTGKSQRDEIPEIPVEAIREALNNSYCHRRFAVVFIAPRRR